MFLEYVRQKLPVDVQFDIPYISVIEVYKYLVDMNPGKSTGLDNISPEILRVAAPVLAEPIASIVNTSIECSVFPQKWKEAKLFPVYKSGGKQNVNNYRPISVLCAGSKILEKHVHKHLYMFLIQYNLITKSQSGFREKHSCQTCMTKVVDQWLTMLNEGGIVGCVQIDLRRAFDVIDHTILIKKLGIYGLSDKSIRWFQSYLSNRSQTVCLGAVKGQESSITYGVPQGSILGPLIFILYISDLPCHLTETYMDMYADDTSLSASGKSVTDVAVKLSSECEIINKWVDNNRLLINKEKSVSMLACSHQKRSVLPTDNFNVYFNDIVLRNVDSCKILGINVDNNLSWRKHIDCVTSRLASTVGLLYRISSYIDRNCMILFYNSYIYFHCLCIVQMSGVLLLMCIFINCKSSKTELQE